MTLDATFRPLATNLLRKFGRSCTFTRVTEGAYDPATGTTTNTEATSTVYTYQSSPNDNQLASGQYQAGQAIFLISAAELGFEPRPNDRITVDAMWTIQRVARTSSGQYDALYECLANQ